jgi:D-serine deaminase-like pyridoxal phosphate-dependent protein
VPDVVSSDPSWQYKGWPHFSDPTDLEAIVSARLNVFSDDFLFPVATISADHLEHNISTVARFCEEHGVSLSPHAKTTMSPEIIERQLAAGAWAITAATASQAQIFRAFGVKRILIAHQLVDPASVRWVANELIENPEVQIMCLVDSIECVESMERALAESPKGRPIGVLVELGVAHGRTGCRSPEEAIEVARLVRSSSRLSLLGVEGYEGVIHSTGEEYSGVDEFLWQVRKLATQLDDLELFDHLDEIIVTAGGSMFPDRVVSILGGDWHMSKPTRLVIRPGCYVTHDSVLYSDSGPFGVRTPMDTYPALCPALTVWSYVVSRPEPDLVVLGFGKRDASFDVDLPKPTVIRRDNAIRTVDGELEVFELNDQHAYVQVEEGFDIAVGDIVGCGISHPCTTFDRWRAIPLVDEELNVVDVIRTFF